MRFRSVVETEVVVEKRKAERKKRMKSPTIFTSEKVPIFTKSPLWLLHDGRGD